MIEPNGGEGENCGEFKFDDWTGGKWNDANCLTELPFVCEKKGQEYVPPPQPGPPEPKVPFIYYVSTIWGFIDPLPPM